MTVHNIEFTINIEALGLNQKTYLKLKEAFEQNIFDDNSNFDFEKLNDLIHLSIRKYQTKNIEYPEFTNDPLQTQIKTTKIEIIG
jgi:hypothetical protein